MKLRSKKGLLLLLATALLVTSAGCPNSTVIGAGNGTVQLAIFNVNQGRWDRGFFQINRIQILPVDPMAVAALGFNEQMTLTPTSVFVDLLRPEVNIAFLDVTSLSQGTYEVVELEISQMFIRDNDPTDPSTCASYQSFYGPPNTITITSFPIPLTFTVARDQDRMLTLTFDVTAFTDSLNAAYTCAPGCGAFCISNFDPVLFGSLYDNFLTLE